MAISGLTEAEVARKVGISKQAVNAYVHGDTVPTVLTLRKLCEVIGCSAEYLIGLNDDMHGEIERICKKNGIVDGLLGCIVPANAEREDE